MVMTASGNEVGLTIVRTIHRHTGATPPMIAKAGASASSSSERSPITGRSSWPWPPETRNEPASLIADHIEGAWAERKRVALT